MLNTNHGHDLINSLLLCIQAALLDGAVSNHDVINVLDLAQDLVSLTPNDSTGSDNSRINSTQDSLTPAYAQYNGDMSIGERILQRRKEFGMPPAVLADMLGVSCKAVTMWEAGYSEPSSKHIIPLAIALQCNPMWLLTGDANALIDDYRLAASDVTPAPEVSDIPTQVMNGVDTAGIGKRIEQRRVELRLTHSQLAAKIGVDKSTEFMWGTGKKIPQSKHMDSIASALNCRVTWLLTGHGEVEAVQHA